jgi:hypothetical protein
MTLPDSEERTPSERALWELERRFWIGDASFHAGHLAPEAWMLLPAPAGLMSRTESLQALAQAPRWSEVAFSETKTLAPGDDIALLVYAAEASREEPSGDMHSGAGPYRAWCSSTYLRTPSGWRLLLHQQTPR